MAGNVICQNKNKMSSFQGQVVLKKDDLACLATEIAQLKKNLPSLLNNNTIDAISRIDSLESENMKLKSQKLSLESEVNRLKKKCDEAVNESQREKQENLRLKCEIKDLNQQLQQQSDYCSSLGMTCCTILWRVSRCEESIQSILLGTKVDEFLSIVSSTLQSYVTAYKDDWQDENLDESQFILALCGIITNIAASAFGRDFLINNQCGKQLVDIYISTLGEAPCGKSARLKNLLLMALYNISINQKGITYIASKPGVLSLLLWLLQEEKDHENQLNTLRIVQSIICDEASKHIVKETIPLSMLRQFAENKNADIRQLALEIISDFHSQVQ